MSHHSKACCTVPPVVVENFNPKGEFSTVNGLKTYQTGSEDAQYGILVIYDIFGFYPQTLQGSDILATGNKDRKFKVFIPDFLEGNPADISWYPPDNEEKSKKLGNFFKTTAEVQKISARVAPVLAELREKNPNIKTWGVVGYCWGAKIVNMVSKSDTPFKAAAVCHPAMVDPADAPNVTIPIAILPSGDEDKDTVNKYVAGLKVAHVLKTFDDQVHGWMAARAELKDDKVKAAYERGYQVLLDFFCIKL